MARPEHSAVATFTSLIDILDDAVRRRGDLPSLAIRTDDDAATRSWTVRELARRSKLAAWRLHELGLRPGDRLVTWSASSPELAAVYFGAMRAGLVLVPLDLHMTPDTIARIVERAGAHQAVLGTGRDAPDADHSGLGDLPRVTTAMLTADPPDGTADPGLPDDWEARVDAFPRPRRADIFEVVFTSGTTGMPKGVTLPHGTVLSSIEAFEHVLPLMEHRAVSILPLSHLFEQATTLLYGVLLGAEVLYVRSRNPRVIFEALREFRTTTIVLVPQVMELFWTALNREIARRGRTASFERTRRIARHLPIAIRRLLFRQIHAQLGGSLRLLISAGAFLPPALQQGWEDLGVVVLQGYGATECGIVACETFDNHPPGTVGRPPRNTDVVVTLSDEGEILVAGPTVFEGYWADEEATRAAFDGEGRYRTGDVAHRDAQGNFVLLGRTRNIIVLPNGFNVYPEDVENALRVAGLGDTVVVETSPGRIEAIVLAPNPSGLPRIPGVAAQADPPADPEEERRTIAAAVAAANRTLALPQRVAGWRLWPGEDFPRTHTFKIRRDLVQQWAATEAPLPLVAPHE